jgi:osmotically inducible lipoprotein OsmB
MIAPATIAAAGRQHPSPGSYSSVQAAFLRVERTGWPRLPRLFEQQFWKEGVPMKMKFLSAAVLAASLLGLGGCATMDRTTVGTVGGAAVGGLVGSAVGGTGGALIGAAGGAYLGHEAARR